jgi:hypothetical protein
VFRVKGSTEKTYSVLIRCKGRKEQSLDCPVEEGDSHARCSNQCPGLATRVEQTTPGYSIESLLKNGKKCTTNDSKVM